MHKQTHGALYTAVQATANESFVVVMERSLGSISQSIQMPGDLQKLGHPQGCGFN